MCFREYYCELNMRTAVIWHNKSYAATFACAKLVYFSVRNMRTAVIGTAPQANRLCRFGAKAEQWKARFLVLS